MSDIRSRPNTVEAPFIHEHLLIVTEATLQGTFNISSARGGGGSKVKQYLPRRQRDSHSLAWNSGKVLTSVPLLGLVRTSEVLPMAISLQPCQPLQLTTLQNPRGDAKHVHQRTGRAHVMAKRKQTLD